MNIVHCCLSNFYIDNYNYQENVLPIINKNDGHQVAIIASTESFLENSKIGYIKEGNYYSKEGIKIYRVKYRRYLPQCIMKKVRSYNNVYKILDNLSPDVIFFHGIQAFELLTVAKYKSLNPYVKFYVDSHAYSANSATNWISEKILHRWFYKKIIKKSYNQIDKIFYITYECKCFLQEIYDVGIEKLEYLPLGGNIMPLVETKIYKDKIRKKLFLKEEDILLVHSGKIDNQKRTIELIEAFLCANRDNLKLIIIGSISEKIKDTIMNLICRSESIMYLGWKSSEELHEYLAACDIYIQPGGQSVTMQNALCCGAALAVYPHKSHKFLLGDSVFYIKDVDDMVELFNQVSQNRELITEKRALSYKLACEKLNYKIIASRLYK